ncbi:hypothetical protein GOODEAATRI_017494 [Goodea atripinnis]|uniref:Uncharacterized protein n=1 Tax=Goodea atripinnis TaxID=208336 RepID=A0ABV0NMM5_9TELE
MLFDLYMVFRWLKGCLLTLQMRLTFTTPGSFQCSKFGHLFNASILMTQLYICELSRISSRSKLNNFSQNLSELGHQVQEGTPDISLPSNSLQLILGDPKAFPCRRGYIVPPVSSGSASGSPPTGTCPENLQREFSPMSIFSGL